MAQIASAVIAIFGFGAILMQLSEIRHNNRTSGARQIYLAYTDLNFKHPEYALPDLDKMKAGDPAIFERYKTFVSVPSLCVRRGDERVSEAAGMAQILRV